LGIGVWGAFLLHAPWGEAFPGQLAGLIAAFAGMVIGSLAPQFITDHRHRKHHQA
jgi:hypothetical protein